MKNALPYFTVESFARKLVQSEYAKVREKTGRLGGVWVGRHFMDEVTTVIEKLAFGAGLGHVDGKVCFVPFTAVGDTARVRITKEKEVVHGG